MLQKLKFRPGINKENTQYATEGGWYNCNNVRFRQGNPEQIGGWTQYSTSTFLGVCRSLWSWVTLAGQVLVGVGTNLKFYINQGGTYYDITPVRATTTLVNAFSTIQVGNPTILVNATSHGAVTNDFVSYSPSTSFGGVTISGQYQITVISPNSYQITASTSATSVVTNTGGTVTATYQINTGSAIQAPNSGWGAGPWGSGTWGNGIPSVTPLQIWSQANFGQNLLYAPVGQTIYYWQAVANTINNPGVALNTLGGNVTLTIASPCVVTLTTAFTLGARLQFASTGALPTGISPGVTYTVYNLSGLTCNLLDPSGNVVNTSGTQSGQAYVSLIVDVPLYQNLMLVSDSSNIILAFGVNDYNSTTQDPMLIRWSNQQDPYNWSPGSTNLSGFTRLSNGSSIIAAVQTRQEIVVFTNTALYSLQFVGYPGAWSSQILGDHISITSTNSPVYASGIVYWMGVNKFYYYNGTINTLECDIRRYIFENINLNQQTQIFGTTNEAFNEVWWFYCSANSTVVDSYAVYNYEQKIWYYGQMSRTAWLDFGVLPNPIAANYSGYLLNHEVGVNDVSTGAAAPINSYISSSEFDIGDGDRFSFVWRILPDVTFTGSTANTSPTATMSLFGLTSPGSGVNETTNANVTGSNTYSVVEQFTTQINTRIRGRQMIFQIGSNKVGTTWQLGTPLIDIRPDGRR